jgi:hypothetical protein
MARNWDQLFSSWVAGFSETTEEKAENALRMIRDAVAASDALEGKTVSVYPTGSYHNNTNTKLESDVDVAVVLTDCWFFEYPATGQPQPSDLGFGTASYGLTEFRNDVGAALVKKFGDEGVTTGSKAFDVHENTYRVDADVAVFIQHRRYSGRTNADGSWHYYEGVEMRPRDDSSKRIINWHDHHHRNGVEKNKRTSKRFKRAARILKRLRDDMKVNGSDAAKAAANLAPSFLLESIAYNVHDDAFTEADYYKLMKALIAKAWHFTKEDEVKKTLVEVNEMKWLFHSSQAWTRDAAHGFLQQAWNHVGYS